MQRIVLLLLILAASSLISCQPSGGQPTDPSGVMDAYTKALNAHSMEGALAFVADDAVYLRPGGTFTGKTQVQTFIKMLIDGKVKTELVGQRQVTGEKVNWTSRITLTDASGNTTTSMNASESVVRNGKITNHQATRMP